MESLHVRPFKILYILLASLFLRKINALHPDAGLNIYQLINKYGYSIEDHDIVTEDGYILRMHRIGSNRNTEKNKIPVLFMHGLLSNSQDWINLGPGKSLGLLLVDEGYDVWLGNQRGNTWCQGHVNKEIDKKTFYDFSFEEIGIYDVTAKIDYILNKTGHSQVHYIGHSQGTTAAFAMLALKPEYNEKIKLFTALAPVANVSYAKQPLLNILSGQIFILDMVINVLNISVLLPHHDVITEIGETFCSDESSLQSYCYDIISFFSGTDRIELEGYFLPVLLSSAPAGASVKQLIHYLQEMAAGKFQRYDYGIENLHKYGSYTPPEYNTSNIMTPVALYYSECDAFTTLENTNHLIKNLSNVVEKRMVASKNYTHMDYLWGKDVNKLVYKFVIEKINSY